MKNKTKNTWKRLLFYLAAIYLSLALCFSIYHFVVDGERKEELRSWINVNFFMQSGVAVYDADDEFLEKVIYEPRWHAIKEFCLAVLCVSVVLWVTSVFVAAWIYADRREKQAMKRINRMIHSYLMHHEENSDVFSEENPELYAQMLEMRTTMQKQEQVLKEEAARKNDLIVYLAHDLKTPLTSVIGYLSLLQEVPEMPTEQKAKYINITLDKALRLEKLINEFFDITRYNLQQICLEEESIDLHYMLLQMTDEFYPILSAHGNTIKLQAEENLIVYGDSEKLARVFNNILKNAVAYSYPDTEILVLAENKEKKVHICFQNQGKTIPKHKLDSIFEKFFRLDESRSANTGGAGLGLAIAKEIVTLHGGEITAVSEAERTTFQITLPVS